MSYTARFLEEFDYEKLSKWWQHYWHAPVNRIFLPNQLSNGILISFDGTPICAGFIYTTSSKYLCWMEFIISNPDIKDKNIRSTSLNLLIKSLLNFAKELGALAVYTTNKNQSLDKHYLNNGFVRTDTQMTNYIFEVS